MYVFVCVCVYVCACVGRLMKVMAEHKHLVEVGQAPVPLVVVSAGGGGREGVLFFRSCGPP
uniref:Secreted protein n=1 Tax=Anguilla anguilla TaxID=7936 RepID=A0A0E9PWD1_ANGAN